MSKTTQAEKPPTPTPPPKPEPDGRSIAERFCAVKAKLGPNCLQKNGLKKIMGVDIYYVMADDLMELIRGLLAQEGLDVRLSMDPAREPREIRVKTQRGERVEFQCWFKIVTKAGGNFGEEVEEDWWLAQDPDIGIASTYAFKQYLLKRLQLSGGFTEDQYSDDRIPPERESQEPLNVKGAERADVSNPRAQRTGTQGPKPPEPPKAEEAELKAAWAAYCKAYGQAAKTKIVELLPHCKSMLDATVEDVAVIWAHLQTLQGGEE